MNRGEAFWKIAPGHVDTCHLPHLNPAAHDPSKVDPNWWRGLGNATVMSGRQFESLARKVLSREKKFHEFLLTRRHQGHPSSARTRPREHRLHLLSAAPPNYVSHP